MAYHPSDYPNGGPILGRVRAVIFGTMLGALLLTATDFVSLGVGHLLTGLDVWARPSVFHDWLWGTNAGRWVFTITGALGGLLASDYVMWIRMTGRRVLPFR
jgi:hypothetical protein